MVKVYVFDLDYTLWPCWCDTHITGPVRSGANNTVIDRFGYSLSLYPDVEEILSESKRCGYTLVAASRTMTPEIASKMLDLFTVDGNPLSELFDLIQYGTGLKKRHIQRAAKELGLEAELKEGLFVLFDDEHRNRDVEDINVQFAYCEDGLTHDVVAMVNRK